MKKVCIAIINGPNINMLGIREPEFYGKETLVSIEDKLKTLSSDLNVELLFFKSNHEGDIVDFIQHNMNGISGIVINPAAFTKAGYSIVDALTAIDIPFVEVHLSNIFSRGGWHAESIFTEKALGQIVGFKGHVYELGLRAIVNHIIADRS